MMVMMIVMIFMPALQAQTRMTQLHCLHHPAPVQTPHPPLSLCPPHPSSRAPVQARMPALAPAATTLPPTARPQRRLAAAIAPHYPTTSPPAICCRGPLDHSTLAAMSHPRLIHHPWKVQVAVVPTSPLWKAWVVVVALDHHSPWQPWSASLEVGGRAPSVGK